MDKRKLLISILAGLMALIMLLGLIAGFIPTAHAAKSDELKAQLDALKEEKAQIDEKIEEIKQQVTQINGVGRLLTDEEMCQAGYPAKLSPFGVCAKVGYAFDRHNHEVATHGYPVDYENFSTFCAINDPDEKMQLNSILDINTLVKQQLRLMR